MSKSTFKHLYLSFFCGFALLLFSIGNVKAQLPLKITAGLIRVDDGSFGSFNTEKYIPLADSLKKALKVNPKDTTSLFFNAVIILFSNDVLAKPYQGTKGALENLIMAKVLADSAIALNMKDFRLKVLRAQIHSELVYRYTADESWKYTPKQMAVRRKDFNTYKQLANKYYDELATIDTDNAYSYQRLKVTTQYKL